MTHEGGGTNDREGHDAPRVFAIVPSADVGAGHVTSACFDGVSVTSILDNALVALTQQYLEGTLTVGGAAFEPSTAYRLTYAY